MRRLANGRWDQGMLMQASARLKEPVANVAEATRPYIVRYPAACLAGALLVGVFLGWLIKRR
jgi:hypothetical protein